MPYKSFDTFIFNSSPCSQSFLYASIYVARAQLRNLHQEGLADFNIPAALLVNSYSEEQLDWYMSVYQLYSGKAK